MDDRAKAALEASIKHWEMNVAAARHENVTLGIEHCSLCGVFFADDCGGCPVSTKTSKRFCANTPYEDAANEHDMWESGASTRDKFRLAAQAELDFLISLREAV